MHFMHMGVLSVYTSAHRKRALGTQGLQTIDGCEQLMWVLRVELSISRRASQCS